MCLTKWPIHSALQGRWARVRNAEGWVCELRQLRERCLDRLGDYLADLPAPPLPGARPQHRATAPATATSDRSVRHATFAIERCYPAGPRRVFAAWADGEARQSWGAARISVSLSTVEIVPHTAGARLTYAEQGVWLDSIDTPEAREGGWTDLLSHLGFYLTAQTAGRALRC